MLIGDLIMVIFGVAVGAAIIWRSQVYAQWASQGPMGRIANAYAYRLLFLTIGMGIIAASLFVLSWPAE